MAITHERLGSVKRFGSRYGRKLKLKFSKIETEQRKLHKCPYCSRNAVKRVSLGIWQCRKCSAKFTGKAYSVTTRITTKEEAPAIEEPVVVEGQEEAKAEASEEEENG